MYISEYRWISKGHKFESLNDLETSVKRDTGDVVLKGYEVFVRRGVQFANRAWSTISVRCGIGRFSTCTVLANAGRTE